MKNINIEHKDITYSKKGNVLIKIVSDEENKSEKITEISLVDDKEYSSKDLIQSYIITVIKYDFSVYEKRILYRIIECFQYQLEGKKLDKNFSIDKDMHGDVEITLPISSLLIEEEDNNYSRIKKALISLERKNFAYEDLKEWGIIRLVERPRILKYKHNIRLHLHPIIYKVLLDFSKGFRKYELKTSMSFRSVYAMRFYELLSGIKKPISYNIENLKLMFQLENKYKLVKDFIAFVIEPAKKELDLKAPFSFSYKLQYETSREQRGRKKIIAITFTPIYHPDKRNQVLEYKNEYENLDLTKILVPEEKEILITLGFSERELGVKYYSLLQEINNAKKKGIQIMTSTLIEYAQKAKHPRRYMIMALRKNIKIWKEKLLNKQNKFEYILEDKEKISYKEEKLSVYSFLKNHLNLLEKEMDDMMNYVLEKGSKAYLNELVHAYGEDSDKIRLHLQRGLEQSKL